MPTPPSYADERFHRLFQRLGTGIAVARADGRIVDANPAFCATVGYSADELRTMTVASLTHPEDWPRNSLLLDEILAGRRESFTIEKRYLTREQKPAWVRAHVSVVHDDCGEKQVVATTEDITRQKLTEARLEESEALLRIAGEVGRVGGWAIDTDPITLYWSDEVHDLAGYARGRTPSLDEAFGLYPPGPDRECMIEAVGACVSGGTPFDVECTFVPVSGEPRRVRVVGEPRRTCDGTVTRIQGAIIDVTDQRRAQQQTELLAERLRTTMESITDAIYTIDTNGRFTYLNARAQEILQRDADELIGRTVFESFSEVADSPLETAYRTALAENRTVVLDEYHSVPLERYFAVTIYPSTQGLAVYFRDVTDQRATRVELDERGARLAQQAALLEAAQDAIVVRDLDGRISYWNKSAERIYGWTAEEALGHRMDALLSLDPDMYAKATDRLLAAGRFVDELHTISKDGRELIIETRWTLVRDDGGEPVSVLGIDTDVTESKRIEAQLLRSQRFESIGKLAGGIAHDLNNALAPIAMSVELLRDGETDPVKLRMLDIVGQSTRHGAELVSQVLSFARGVDGKRVPVSLGDIVEEVRRITADTFPKNITVEADVPADLWRVAGDPTQIQQVLVNLCVNARDAMPDGGTLSLTAGNVAPGTDAPAVPPGPSVTLLIRDTGVGIEADACKKMFDPFFSTKPHGEGTGLGLSTSAVIVASHGGCIEVDTAPGEGTTFTISLPAEQATGCTPPASNRELPCGDGELVLVVDDEHAIRELAGTMLERFGYRVLVAAEGQEAIMLFEARRDEIAVVLTDLMMPVMDGYAVIDRLLELRPELPIIASTGLNTPGAADRSFARGAVRCLAKPYGTERLLKIIREVLDRGPTEDPLT